MLMRPVKTSSTVTSAHAKTASGISSQNFKIFEISYFFPEQDCYFLITLYEIEKRGDGTNTCEEIPIVNECEDAKLNTCSAQGGVCTDKQYGFDCACAAGFLDKNSEKPGTVELDLLQKAYKS